MIDYSKLTLCPELEYKCYCQVGGRCEYCPNFHTNKGEDCKGCGANFEDQNKNTKARLDIKYALQHTPTGDKSNQQC